MSQKSTDKHKYRGKYWITREVYVQQEVKQQRNDQIAQILSSQYSKRISTK